MRRHGLLHRFVARIGYQRIFGRAAYARFLEDVALHRKMVTSDAPEFSWTEFAATEIAPTPAETTQRQKRIFPEAAE